MLASALGLAKGNDETKIGISVQVPKTLKEDFEEICKTNNVSMASMMQALIQIAVEEAKGVRKQGIEISEATYAYLASAQKERISQLENKFEALTKGGSPEALSDTDSELEEAKKLLKMLTGAKK